MTQSASRRKHIVVVGAGFGGVAFCQSFPEGLADITLVDRNNYHLFQPLLYQVATADLSPADIAEPIRTIFDRRRDITVLMDEVTGIDRQSRTITMRRRTLEYDHLVLAIGARTGYFGNNDWARYAGGLKGIEDALNIRNRVLSAFEEAENCPDPSLVKCLTTFVVVGGGPTGVELAGALGELTRRVLRRDFKNIDTSQARVFLIQGAPRLLPPYHPALSEYARQKLVQLGVDVRVSSRVVRVGPHQIELDNGKIIEAANIIWCAGVEGHPLARKLGLPTDRTGRIQVEPDLRVPGHPEIFAIGDIAALTDARGVVVPGVAPAALQMGRYAARVLAAELRGRPKPPPFVYFDKGSMATIGRAAAVLEAGKLRMTGFLAWVGWLIVHLAMLVGFNNKVSVLTEWIFRYITYRQGARIITTPRTDELLRETP
ncbi:NAD(P)/FAD-dependent oxidoreductase [Chloracidobacterium aggregatum]|uniref:NADH:ubiquinone reductase (non-electrogenic) n=1 Tax=Chloracidobacterium sp. N TaxID=2821540 RepID=A0ABX8B556_9BACT|nr:NAD(P)/FAD-dependent oxidoreductase [Chloracidobacterium aggregatum]QUV84831.1 NAD(P)/FAD-dependent oxidoreductase [Chloracidobacterium sp. 2]QUV91685.1 NAD(P)/FAD-dependent oxidoreductase [Chloracidobacterium sp. A]QUV94860.1 NAD(P)/FAD-dependent oxidoreductase [Chloracidobacterium sp. N]QUV95972.1 NAD(P)/FAD-dependent oxidoreductase [Chloracidobacterium sp. E]